MASLLLMFVSLSPQTASAEPTYENPPPVVKGGQGGVFPDKIMSRLQSTYNNINDFTISFTQRSSIKGFGEKVFEGKLYIKKPKMIRWDYSRPLKQNIYINGKTAILYIPDQKQAIKQDLSRHPDAEPALGLLSNIGKWQDTFIIKSDDASGENVRLVLTPKNMATVEKVVVEIDTESYLINNLTIFEKSGEKGGNKVSFNFSNIKTNNSLKDKLFDFTIPKGVEVLEY